MKKSNNRQRKTGFARTKRFPHRNHPAFFKKTDNDNIVYVTFTTRENPNVNNKPVPAIRLNKNIEPSKEGKKFSHVLERVFVGKRSSLKEKMENCKLSNEDRVTIEKIFITAPKINVPHTSNSSNKNKKPRK